jgi:hypothetical protein
VRIDTAPRLRHLLSASCLAVENLFLRNFLDISAVVITIKSLSASHRTTGIMAVGKEAAIAEKEKGNEAYKAHDWQGAVEHYSKAIDLYDQEPAFYTNRAQVSFLKVSHDQLADRLLDR